MGEKKNTRKNQPPPSKEDEYETRDNEGQGDGEKVEEIEELSEEEIAAWRAKKRGAKPEEHGVPKPKEQPKPEEKPKEEIFAEIPPSNLEKRCAQLKKKLEEFLKKADWTATKEAGKLRQETNDFYSLLREKFKTKPGAEEEKKLHSVWGKISAVVGKFKKKCREAGLEVEEIEKKEEVREEAPSPKEKLATTEELAKQEKKWKEEGKKEAEERKKIKVEVEGRVDVFFKGEPAKEASIVPSPEKPTSPELEKTPAQAIEDNLCDLCNQTKILERYKDNAEERDKALKQRKFTSDEKLLEEKETREVIDYLMKNAGKALDEKGKKEFSEKIKKLAEQTGLDEIRIQEISDQIKLRKEEYVNDKILASKKPSTKSSFIRLGLYGAAGLAMRYSGAGYIGGLAMAGVRSIGLISQEYKEKKALKDEKDMQFDGLQIRLEKGEDEGSKELQKKFLQDFASLTAVAKQEQIDNTFEERTGAIQELHKLESAYLEDLEKSKGKMKGKGENYEKLLWQRCAVWQLLQQQFESLVKTDAALGALPEAKQEALKRAVGALMWQDSEDSLFEQELEAKNPSVWSRLAKGAAKLMDHPVFGGFKSSTAKMERAVNCLVTGTAGVLSQEVPVLREVLLGYAGMQAGGVLADMAVAKWGSKLVRGFTREEMEQFAEKENPPDEFIEQAKVQLLDANFKKNKPADAARLKQIVEKMQERKLRQAENALDLVQERTARLEDTYTEKRRAEIKAAAVRLIGRVTGATLGVIFSEVLGKWAEETKAKAAAERVMPVAPPVVEKPVISDVLTAHKGDTVWGLIEKQLGAHHKDFARLDEAQKTYLIDAFKDKVVASPGAYGLKDVHHLVSGQKVDLTSLFRDEAVFDKILGQATKLSQEQINNILDNNDFLRSVARTPMENLSQHNLQHAVDIMGGHDLAPSSYVHALDQKLAAFEEIKTTISPEIAAKINAADKMYDVLGRLGLDNFSLDHHSIMSEGTGTFFLVDPQYNEVPVVIKDWLINKIGDIPIDPPVKLVPGEPLPGILRGKLLEELWNARWIKEGIIKGRVRDIYDAAQNWMPKDLRGLSARALVDLKPEQLDALNHLAGFEANKSVLNKLIESHCWNSAENSLSLIKQSVKRLLESPEGVWADGNRINKWLGKVGDLIQQGRELYPFAGADGMTVRAVDEILGGSGMNFRMSDIAGANVKELTKMTGTMEDLIGDFKSIAKDATKSLEMQEKAKEAGKWLTKFLRIIQERKTLVGMVG